VLTPRLRLVSLDLAGYAALRAGREEFARYVGARLDPDWPTFGEHLGYFEDAIRADPTLAGWATWVAVERGDDLVIGEGGYKGAPDAEGAVEIGYAIVAMPRRRRGCCVVSALRAPRSSRRKACGWSDGN